METFSFRFNGRLYTASVNGERDEILSVYDNGAGRNLAHLDCTCACGCVEGDRHAENPPVWRAALGLIDA